MKKTSKHATRNPGTKPFAQFVHECIAKKGSCGEPEVVAFICDSYKREYVIRHAAADCARLARLRSKCPDKNPGVRFLDGVEISEQEAERLYSRGIVRLLNDIRATYRKASNRAISYCPQTKTFALIKAKELDVTTC
jgi:hypothetical protein